MALVAITSEVFFNIIVFANNKIEYYQITENLKVINLLTYLATPQIKIEHKFCCLFLNVNQLTLKMNGYGLKVQLVN